MTDRLRLVDLYERVVASKAVLGAMLALLLLLASMDPAGAHRGDQSYLYLDVGEGLVARLQMPIADIETHLGFDLSDARASGLDPTTADGLVEYALAHMAFSDKEGPWPLVLREVRILNVADYLEVSFDVTLPTSDVPSSFSASLDPFFDERPDRDALLIIANDLSRGVIQNEADHLLRFTDSRRTAEVELGSGSQWKNFKASVEIGIDHIKSGPDHILFIAALLLPSVLIFRDGWLPAPEFRSMLWRVLKIMSIFTVAHSVTFTLAGLSIIDIGNSRLVEVLIAISIGAAAAHNLWPIVPEREWLIAAGFGLIHGLGFASLVGELQVTRSTQLVSLLGRNVGIEIGQAIVVLLVFPVLFLLRRTPAYRSVFVGGSLLLMATSLGWAAERSLDTNPVTTSIVDRVFEWPRALVLVILGGAVAGAVWLRSRTRDELIDVGSMSGDGT